MRIDALNQVSQLYKAASPKKKEEVVRKDKSDMLEISQAGRDYQIAKQAVKDAPDVREDLVSRIKEQLATGTYEVSSKDLADKMVEDYYGDISW